MKTNRVTKFVLGAVAASVLMSGVLTTTAAAQNRTVRRPRPVIVYRPYYRYYSPFYDPFYSPFYDPFWGSSWNTRTIDPIAYQQEQGYSKGRSKGKEDAKKGRTANPAGQKDYIKSNSLAYREAFVKGYTDRYQEQIREMREEGD